jgi:AraC-like DNA-binding protein
MSTADDRGARWAGALALGSGVVVYVGPGASADRHRHDAIQLLIGVDAPVTLNVQGTSREAGAAVVPSGVEHSVVARGRTIVVLVEPVGPVGAATSRFATDHLGIELGDRVDELPAPGGADAVVAWSRRTLERLTGVPCAVDLTSVRPEVLELVRFVDEHLDGSPRLAEVAERVGRSPRQLRRDLAVDLGMPFRRYVLWRRLRHAVLEVRGGRDLTTAAATAGFADSAHFSRVFRGMFGLTPSGVLPLLEVSRTELDALI